MTNDPMTIIKKYRLKPGNHQFVPRSHATHNNDNLTDAEAKWYLEQYPHIATLFETIPEKTVKSKPQSVKSSKIKSVKSQPHENLSTTN